MPTERLFAAQLQELFLRTRTSSCLALLAIPLLAGLHYRSVAPAQIAMWTMAMLCIYAVRIALAHGFLSHRPADGEASPLWLDVGTMATAAAGGGWGAMLFLLDSGRLDLLFTVKLAFIAAACAFTINSLAVIRFAYLAFLLPALSLTVAYALMETPFLSAGARFGLIAAAAVYGAMLLILSGPTQRLSSEALALRVEQGDLRARLAAALDNERALREQLEQQARQMETTHLQMHLFATHDPLTRVYNRHRICEALVRELHLRRRYRIPVSALVVEIDAFGGIVERFGQARADELLVAFATFLAADLREIDYAGRWGGEKFCCVLPRTDGQEALECAERIRRKIEHLGFLGSAPELTVTASCGVSEAVEDDDPERVLARADAAVYAARSKGGNRAQRLDADAPEVCGAAA